MLGKAAAAAGARLDLGLGFPGAGKREEQHVGGGGLMEAGREGGRQGARQHGGIGDMATVASLSPQGR